MPQVAYRTIRSRRKFINAPLVRKMMDAWLDSEAKPHFIQRFEFVVANWKNRVTFKARKFVRADSISINVFPDKHKDIWGYVVNGTPPHVIRPKGPWTLKFRTGYKPKTLPPAKFGGPGKATGPVVRAKVVHHPGTDARPFPKEIMKDEQAWFSRNAENAWRRAIRAL